MDEREDRGSLCACEEGPEELMESRTPEGRTYDDVPSSLFFEGAGSSAWAWCEEEAIGFSCLGSDSERFSAIKEMAEGGNTLFALFLQNLFHHASKQVSNMFSSLFS